MRAPATPRPRAGGRTPICPRTTSRVPRRRGVGLVHVGEHVADDGAVLQREDRQVGAEAALPGEQRPPGLRVPLGGAVVLGEGGVVRPPDLVVAVPGEGHECRCRAPTAARGRSVSGRCISRYQRSASARPAAPAPPATASPPGTSTVRRGGRLRVPLGVQRRPAVELPGQQGPADAASPEVGAHPALEVDREARRGRSGRPSRWRSATTSPAGSHTARPSRAGSMPQPAPPLGDVLGVGVLAGVVDLLGGREERGDGGRVVGGQRAGGEAVGQHGEVGHGCRG